MVPKSLTERLARRIEVGANAAVICVAVVLVWFVVRPAGQPPPGPELPTDPLSLEDAHALGSPDAAVGMVVFGDFQCPACRQLAQSVLPDLRQQYVARGKLIIGFRHLPSEAVHPLAMGAARAAECASEQGRFWPVHDFLFSHSATLDLQDIAGKAAELGLAGPVFEMCLGRGDDGRILEDVKLGKTLGLAVTPTTFFGPTVFRSGRLHIKPAVSVSGAKTPSVFRAVLDRLIANAAREPSAKD